VNNNPALFEVMPPTSYGYVIFYIKGVTVQDSTIFVSNDDKQKNITMDNSFRYDHTNITDQNKDMLKVEVLTDGVSEPVMLAAGNYTAHLRQGNGDQPETQKFVIGGGATERVVFLGAAIPTVHILTCKNFTVIDTPGTVIHHDEVNHTVHHDASYETVIDVPAHTEYRYWISSTPAHTEYQHRDWIVDVPGKAAWTESRPTPFPGSHYVMDSPAVPEVGHYELYHAEIPAVPAVPEYYTVVDVLWGHGNCEEYNGNGHYDFKVGNQKYRFDNSFWADDFYTFHPAVPAVPAVPAWTESHPTYFPGSHYVMDHAAIPEKGHYELFHPAVATTYKWSSWSAWSDTPDTATPTHQVNTRFVPEDMGNGHYSEWSSTPGGSCAPSPLLSVVIIREPCETREVPATYKQVLITEPYDEIVVDTPAWDEHINAVTHEITVCSYGTPEAPIQHQHPE
jgi:hypothetical protein